MNKVQLQTNHTTRRPFVHHTWLQSSTRISTVHTLKAGLLYFYSSILVSLQVPNIH